MSRFSWTALGMALLLTACNASAPNEASEGAAAKVRMNLAEYLEKGIVK